MRKKTSLAVIRSRNALTTVELHDLAREAASAAVNRETGDLARAIELIQEAELLARAVAKSTTSMPTGVEVRAAVNGLNTACEHLRGAIATLERAQ